MTRTKLSLLAAAALATATLAAAFSGPATADDDERGFGERGWFGRMFGEREHEGREGREGGSFGAVTDPATLKECGDCHMAFQPGLLPARSWKAVMAGLGDHFGENASLPAETAAAIEAYLVANAGDAAGGAGSSAIRGIAATDAPLRISDTPYWIAEHRGEVRPGAFDNPKVGSKANCVACHRGAEKGYYEDD